ncbi:probable histone-lysine N-methyltransferase CG1716 isoform X2 [Sitodiplosis mosellana]|uniref:probable histone-lysine N-methyltransferase CG1716 isoform X2 n=1 Tax=Sitodiplosis mosellana TaxID=263140 RepID=UPI00244452E4|nr:probable histone-lysine N-methyltransferase CG1716 isoform X2 [Sitodiplosis mosellana]XP_055314215.1 probable histone-lysine N-methyltransferase CG1716 isoform X2 [Sitodiplosis mosellana]XP_055314216.1 probable histone-lysine N-methyltransferase CG1716 isoform X2 [Sitodiplosis mosellana]XP_055314217.1 probable histone-lysine N-methyltransferase CG1716 isoform X2 [Sitodiplosis mosellana]
MGRKEKSINATVGSPASTSIISKRTYSRQLPCSTLNHQTETISITTNQSENVKMDETDSMHTIVLGSNNTDNNSLSLDARLHMPLCKGRSNSKKHMKQTGEMQAETQLTNSSVSMISQRPRRQVKHKFIKSANANVTVRNENSVANNDVSDESNSLLSTLSPNSKMRLVPMVYRLPMNASKLNWQDLVSNNSTETTEVECETTTILEDEPGISIADEKKTEHHNVSNKSKEAIRSVRDLRQNVCPIEPVECYNFSEIFDKDAVETQNEANNTFSGNNLTSTFYDDEDDIMIVEEKDALDIPDQIEFVAEEVVIEETIGDDYTEIICVSPKYMNEMSSLNGRENDYNNESSSKNESYENNKSDLHQVGSMSTEEENTQTEPIYLSDSLSCFDSNSDSETQHSEVLELAEKFDASKGIVSVLTEKVGEDDEAQPLNESADDVIIVPDCTDTIEIDRSDTDDERFSGTISFETCIESDSQPSVDSVKHMNNENRFKSRFNNSQLYETTTDADDDSSEVEKLYVRSRRDNVARKNYSCRRNYARRKGKNDLETPTSDEMSTNKKADNLSNKTQATETIEYSNSEECSSDKMTSPAIMQDCNTTDEESPFNMTKAKAVRTYIRKKVSTPNSTSKIVPLKDNESREPDLQMKNLKSSCHEVQVSSKPESIQIPRKRGRPRKKAVLVMNLKSNDKSSVTDGKASSSTSRNQSPIGVPEVQKNEPNKKYDNVQESHTPIENTAEFSEFIEDISSMKIEDVTIINEVPDEKHGEKMGIEIAQSSSVNEINIVSESNVMGQKVLNEEQIASIEVENYELNSTKTETQAEAMDVERVEKDKSIKKDPAEYDDQMMAESTNINSTAEDSLSDQLAEHPKVKEQHAAITMYSFESLVTDTKYETTVILQQKKVESSEPAIENISRKIETIEINTEPKESIICESGENFKKMQSVDTKPDVNKFEIKSEEGTMQIKPDKVKPQMEMTSALVDLSVEVATAIEDTSIRRSGRIRTINKTKQRSQGMGLVRDKKRALVIIDEDSSNASFDVSTENTLDKDALQSGGEPKVNPRIKTDEELERERINRENGMKLFIAIADNEYRSERTISKEAKKMTCDCFLTQSEIERGEMGCGDDCLNRMLLIECGPKCVVGDRCTNRRFQKHANSACTIFKTEKKGYGLIATSYIPAGVFIMEYVGEVLNSKQFEKRASDYSKLMNAHYYFMALSSDCVIDATKKGNISRFINHSCDPNAETQKWTVNGELRIGFFSKKPIMSDEEITFDYQFQRYGKEAQKCYCESINCRGWIGGEPDSEEEIESDDDEESEDDVAAVTRDESEFSESKISVTLDETIKKKAKTPKPRKSKDATKKPVKRERTKASHKISNDFKKHMKRAEIMEDPDLDKEIDVLAMSGLKNQVQTLQFSRLMVRAKLQKAKLRLLKMLREGELPCRRLFLDYHGLKLMHSWMSDFNSSDPLLSLTFRLDIIQTLEKLPITNKTMLQDSKVLSTVQRWSTISEYSFLVDETHTPTSNQKVSIVANDESSPSDSGSGTPILNDETSSPKMDEMSVSATINSAASPDSLLIDQKPSEMIYGERNVTGVKPSDVLNAIPQILEQNSTIKGMGVDLLKSIISTTEKNTKIIEDSEKLPDGDMGKVVRDICLLASKLVSSWKQLPESFKIPKKLRIEQMKEHEREADESYKENVEEKTSQKSHSTFSSTGRFSERVGKITDIMDSREKDPRFRRSFNNSTISKHQRRQMFEAKVAQEDAERKKTMEHIIHEARCAFFQLDPRITRDFMVPMCVNPTTGQWFGNKMIKIPTPPSHSHIKPPPVPLPTEINEYIIPPIDLPDLWKYAINERGQIYYYHTKILLPQWEPPIKLLPLMEEHRINDIEIKVENIDTPQHTATDDGHEIEHMEHDCDDEDEDVVSILSSSTMNPNCLLELKSDPILEKYNDDDSSSTDSDDSLVIELAELEAKYSYIRKKTEAYWINMKRPPNLNEEIAAMAKSDPACISIISTENIRARDEENQNICVAKSNTGEEQCRKKKCRMQLVQEIRISPLSEEMKRELRRDSRRYKENKAKLRRQKEMLLKRKSDMKVSHTGVPVRKLKKITEGLPQVSKHAVDSDSHGSNDNHLFSVGSFSSSRYHNSDSFDVRRTKSSAFAPLPAVGLSASSSSSLTTSHNTIDIPSRTSQSSRNGLPSTSLTQSIVNKLPSIGHKFVGDTEELIMKNTIRPIRPAESVSASAVAPIVNTIRNTPIQQTQQSLVRKPSHSIVSTSKSSPKPFKKKKTSDPNECIDVNSPAAKKIKEKFKSDISGHIVYYLKPYFSKTCTVGQIQSSDDFRHLARKLTFFVMLKELKYCNNVSLLEVTDSVKNKAREYIKKYMSKFGKSYVRDENEKDYHFEDL